MKSIIRAAAALPLLAAPALAQVAPSDTSVTDANSGGAIANPGQLSIGNGGSSAIGGTSATGVSTPNTNPGQLDFSRTGGTGGAPSGTGAGIAAGSAGVPQTDDTYLYPLYGKSFR